MTPRLPISPDLVRDLASPRLTSCALPQVAEGELRRVSIPLALQEDATRLREALESELVGRQHAEKQLAAAGRQGAAASALLRQAQEREASAHKEARAAAAREARARKEAGAARRAASLERSLARAAAQRTGWALAQWRAAAGGATAPLARERRSDAGGSPAAALLGLIGIGRRSE